jgi:Carboxypeptidase regulatory-like domain
MHLFFRIQLIIVPLSLASAQTAQLSGVVRDPSQAVIAGASVIIRGDETQIERIVTTNNDGVYDVPFLAPATYTVSVEAIGSGRPSALA